MTLDGGFNLTLKSKTGKIRVYAESQIKSMTAPSSFPPPSLERLDKKTDFRVVLRQIPLHGKSIGDFQFSPSYPTNTMLAVFF